MSHQSPKPFFGGAPIGGAAMRRLSDGADFVHARAQEILDQLAGDPGQITRFWIAKITSTEKASTVPIWVYELDPKELTIPRNGAGVVNAAVTDVSTGDLPTKGKGYNLRELLNTASWADGVDLTALPGTFAVKPIEGYVHCWHERLRNGDTVILFSERNPIDGACAA